jgi:hypothetical protein
MAGAGDLQVAKLDFRTGQDPTVGSCQTKVRPSWDAVEDALWRDVQARLMQLFRIQSNFVEARDTTRQARCVHLERLWLRRLTGELLIPTGMLLLTVLCSEGVGNYCRSLMNRDGITSDIVIVQTLLQRRVVVDDAKLMLATWKLPLTAGPVTARDVHRREVAESEQQGGLHGPEHCRKLAVIDGIDVPVLEQQPLLHVVDF